MAHFVLFVWFHFCLPAAPPVSSHRPPLCPSQVPALTMAEAPMKSAKAMKACSGGGRAAVAIVGGNMKFLVNDLQFLTAVMCALDEQHSEVTR